MAKITFKDFKGNSKTIEVENGLSVMEGAIKMKFLELTLIVVDRWLVQLAMFMSKTNG